MTTPEQYFTEHPDVAVLAQQPDGFDFYLELRGKALDEFRNTGIDIDWTGFSRRIAYNPKFAWGKRRKVEWTGDVITQNVNNNPGRYVTRQLCTAEGEPLNLWQIGRYVDAPAENPAPELSRFLPEGWGWSNKKDAGLATGLKEYSEYTVRDHEGKHLTAKANPDVWHSLGLLHPSEGGGFQRIKSLTTLNKRDVDILYRNGFIDYGNSGYSSGDCVPQGWRTHFKKGGEA